MWCEVLLMLYSRSLRSGMPRGIAMTTEMSLFRMEREIACRLRKSVVLLRYEIEPNPYSAQRMWISLHVDNFKL
jgi:hypothetical protein